MIDKLINLYFIYKNNRSFKILLKNYCINDYEINNGFVNVFESVRLLNHIGKQNGLIPIKFGKIDGDFDCSFYNPMFDCYDRQNGQLKTLENCPSYVSEDFKCSYNKLTTLIGGPSRVGGGYYCDHNNLKDVYGFPENFNGELYITNNPVNEILDLVYLEKTPWDWMDKHFLYGHVYIVDRFPTNPPDDFNHWNIGSFGRNIYNKSIDRDNNKRIIKFIRLLNDYTVIRNGDTIIKDRLEEAFSSFSETYFRFYKLK